MDPEAPRRPSRAADWPVGLLREAKGPARVSVVLPALDEAGTIGGIVAALAGALAAGPTPLVDEIVVVDSGSADDTARIARAAGARVVAVGEVLPHLAAGPGKGEALWRGLAATDGDLVAFCDADLASFTPDYVTGLLGPLLTDPAIDLVKACYDRPLAGIAQAGGRVTELVARPLINLYRPSLAGIVQPLAGEYAARRDLLESLPLPAGYGVDIAVLLYVEERRGASAIAQVDLGERRHRHHGDEFLGAMAAEVIAAMAPRLGMAPPRSGVLTRFRREGSTIASRPAGLRIDELPPLAEVARATLP